MKLTNYIGTKESGEDERKQAAKSKGARDAKSVDSADSELFDALKEVRQQIAQKKKVPNYFVFTNATLVDMCEVKPTDEIEMLEVMGVGSKKLEAYGDQFISVIREYLDK